MFQKLKAKSGITFSVFLLLLMSGTGISGYISCAMAGNLQFMSEARGPGDQNTLHIHFISGSEEYESEKSLKYLQQRFRENFPNIKVTASWGEDRGSDLPDIEHLEHADLMVVFTRRMTLPEDQLHYILQHVEKEKPVIGIRTASHAFQDFLEMDARIFGGNYTGHGDDEAVELTIAEGAERHPVLRGVQAWTRPGKIYHNPEPGENARILFYGTGLDSEIHEPLAWTNKYGEYGRAFYTSMGFPADFENEHFLQMLYNAITWSTGFCLSNP
jgi:type 1 glutamine amidotransferase